MKNPTQESNEGKLNFLSALLHESTQPSSSVGPFYFSIEVIRFGVQLMILKREPAESNLKDHVARLTKDEGLQPDTIVVGIYNGKSRNSKPVASYRLDYKSKSKA